MGGLFTHSGSMFSMVTFARAKIWSHYDSIMAVTGTGVAVTVGGIAAEDDDEDDED